MQFIFFLSSLTVTLTTRPIHAPQKPHLHITIDEEKEEDASSEQSYLLVRRQVSNLHTEHLKAEVGPLVLIPLPLLYVALAIIKPRHRGRFRRCSARPQAPPEGTAAYNISLSHITGGSRTCFEAENATISQQPTWHSAGGMALRVTTVLTTLTSCQQLLS